MNTNFLSINEYTIYYANSFLIKKIRTMNLQEYLSTEKYRIKKNDSIVLN